MTNTSRTGAGKDISQQRLLLGGGAAVTMTGRLVGRAIHFTSQAVVGATLGPSLFGVYSICWSVLRSLGLLATLGMHNAVIRFGSRDRHLSGTWDGVRRLANRTALITFMGGVVAGGALFASAEWIGNSVFEIPRLVFALRVTAAVLPVMTVTLVASAATRVTQRMVYSVVIEDLVQPGVNLALILVAVIGFGWGLSGSLIALVASYLASAAVGLRTVWKLYPVAEGSNVVESETVAGVLRYAIPTAVAGDLGNCARWVDRFFLGFFRPAAEVGLYQAAAQVAGLFALILTAFNSVLAPMIAESAAAHDVSRMATAFKAATKWGVYASIPAVLVVAFVGREVLVLIFGVSYAGASSPLVILLVGQFVNLATGAVGITLMLTGHERRWLAITALGMVVNAAMNILLIPRFGVDGAAVACIGGGSNAMGLFHPGPPPVRVHRPRYNVVEGSCRGWVRGHIAGRVAIAGYQCSWRRRRVERRCCIWCVLRCPGGAGSRRRGAKARGVDVVTHCPGDRATRI